VAERLALALPALLAVFAPLSAPFALPAAPLFEEVAARAGIAFVHTSGSAAKDWIAEVNGSGVALFDHDGDGDLDIYFVNGSRFDLPPGEPRPRNALYRNDGGWRFTDVTEESGTGDDGWGCGAAVADVDNDGDLDLYVTNMGPNVLFLNRGGGRFDRAARSGAEDSGWGAGASFADFDRDGLVDLYVANYLRFDRATAKRRGDPSCQYKGVAIFCGPGGLEPEADVLFRNVGGGRFHDVTKEWGADSAPPSYSLGTLVVDLNRDGFMDLLVANDTQRNYAFLNAGGKRFEEAGLFLGLAYNDYGVAQAGMGLASGDLRGTGEDAIFVTNFEDDTNTLYLRDGELYVEGTHPAGLGGPSYKQLGWGTFFFDAENDGDLDLFIANGHVAPQADSMRSSLGYRQANQLFLSDGAGRFTDASRSAGPGLAVVESSRGAAAGDLDQDGDLDIVVSNIDERPSVLENQSPARSWLEVRLAGTRSNRAAIGARVSVTAGGRRLERTIQSGMSYASQCEIAAHFGLGDATRVDALRVDWPSGLSESFPAPAPGRRVLVIEGRGEPAP
jgi:hypothetical protein